MQRSRYVILGVVLLLVLSAIILIVSLAVTPSDFFSRFETAQDVSDYLRSQVEINSTTTGNVQPLIQSWDLSECFSTEGLSVQPIAAISEVGQAHIICFASTKNLWWFYQITFTFEDALLADITVDEIYRGL